MSVTFSPEKQCYEYQQDEHNSHYGSFLSAESYSTKNTSDLNDHYFPKGYDRVKFVQTPSSSPVSSFAKRKSSTTIYYHQVEEKKKDIEKKEVKSENEQDRQKQKDKRFTIKQGQYHIGNYAFYTDQNNSQNLLGNGSFGKVFKGYHRYQKQSPQVAIKVILINSEQTIQLCRQEALRQQLVRSEGIVTVFMSKVIKRDKDSTMFLIASELMDGELKIPDNGHSPEKALEILKNILKCYKQIYKRGMIHRDLKPQNILIKKYEDQTIMKISDFGTALQRTDKKPEQSLFTQDYASPEQMRNKDYTQKCDVYAIGCIFFQLLYGKNPKKAKFTKPSNIMKMDKIVQALKDKNIPDQMIDFLQGCLREKQTVQIEKDGYIIEDPKRSRLSWEDVYLHPLFKGQLSQIPRQVAGNDILLTIRTYAEVNSLNIIDVFRRQRKFSNVFCSPQSRKNKLVQILQKNNIFVPEQDLNRLQRMFGGKDNLNIKQFLDALKSIENKQFSNYRPMQAYAFFQIFNFTAYELNQQRIKPLQKWIEELRKIKYQYRQQLQLNNINFTSFPLLPPMHNLEKLTIQDSQIYSLEARLNAPSLKDMVIASSHIQKIITIRGCPNLKLLKIAHCKLTQIQGLQMLLKLEQLDLSYNRLIKISNIEHLKNLKLLNLDNNKISVIEGLSGCSSLHFIDLRNNRIQVLDNTIFKIAIPLKKIYLQNNMIENIKKNRQLLRQFHEQYPQIKVQVIQKVITSHDSYYQSDQYFDDGMYKIVSHNNPFNSIGIGKSVKNNARVMQMTRIFRQNTEQLWHIKHVQNGQYLIISHNKKQIVQSDSLRCCLQPYEQDSPEKIYYGEFRWIFEKKYQNNEPFYSIENIKQKKKINELYYGDVMLFSERCKKQNDLWSIEPVQMPL